MCDERTQIWRVYGRVKAVTAARESRGRVEVNAVPRWAPGCRQLYVDDITFQWKLCSNKKIKKNCIAFMSPLFLQLFRFHMRVQLHLVLRNNHHQYDPPSVSSAILRLAISIRLRAPEACHLDFRLREAGPVILEVLGNLVITSGRSAGTEGLTARQHASGTQAGHVFVDWRRTQRLLGRLLRRRRATGGLLAAERAHSDMATLAEQTRSNGEHN